MPTLDRLLDRFPRSASLLLGALAATGYPPLKLWPLALLAMGIAVFHLTRSGQWRGALLRGWLFGVAHFTTTNAWIATAFTHQSEMPAILGWFAVPLLSFYLAVYPALAALGSWLLVRDKARPLAMILAFAALWIVTEWLRSWVFTGYAWGPFSLALLGPDTMPGVAMLLPWFGTYALSGMGVVIAGLLVWWLRERRWVPAALLAIATAILMYLPVGERMEGTRAYLVAQPDFSQDDITDPRLYERAFVRITGLSERRQGETGKRIVLWPESGMPDYLRDGYPARYYRATTAGADPAYARRRVGAMMGPDTVLLTGATDLEIENGKAAAAYNVVTALDGKGRIIGSYRKAHLVPYGEYLPLRELLEPLGLSRLVAGTIEFREGPGPRTLDLGEYGRVGTQICYEIVFSGNVVDDTDRPDFIFNPSNDGWFGAWGPPQQFAQARMRAIEEGLPVIRATTTGISGVIDADGVVRQSLGMHARDRLTGLVPPAKQPTLFARLGNALGLGWAALLLALSLVAMRWRRS
ncbi:apolipoprotein N-acyltransferase [Erythrobacter sp. SDW2]|uniref:apolipoprotein N-acyltransferase n=1 Tax=Erythrobacter sp. SDW2 TaxID=2907154 RepID=UPI001F352D53|nr:apolipoprotein N-acyltransferase [Erythrobacter sp. SDW2]UIP07082.1 apolipoprotein N-acyltransferase [Erythrobacter sp. SDW2]